MVVVKENGAVLVLMDINKEEKKIRCLGFWEDLSGS